MNKINDFIKNDVLTVFIMIKNDWDLIFSTTKSWDTYEAAKKLELEIGDGLQFIKINGRLVVD